MIEDLTHIMVGFLTGASIFACLGLIAGYKLRGELEDYFRNGKS